MLQSCFFFFLEMIWNVSSSEHPILLAVKCPRGTVACGLLSPAPGVSVALLVSHCQMMVLVATKQAWPNRQPGSQLPRWGNKATLRWPGCPAGQTTDEGNMSDSYRLACTLQPTLLPFAPFKDCSNTQLRCDVHVGAYGSHTVVRSPPKTVKTSLSLVGPPCRNERQIRGRS